MEVYASQTQLLECLRDIWPTQKGLASLLFQNDLFWRLRRLEIKVEGGNPEDAVGFLPDDYPKWTGPVEYETIWAVIEGGAAFDVTEPLDALEDAVCSWVEDMIPDRCAFFDAALDTGYLDEKWLHAAEMLRGLEEVKAAEAAGELPAGELPAGELPAVKTATVTTATVTTASDAVTIEPIASQTLPETIISAPPLKKQDTRRLRRVGRPLTPSFRRKIRSTRRSKSGQ
jgi:hypothetical protein